jgi:hypothetical protein
MNHGVVNIYIDLWESFPGVKRKEKSWVIRVIYIYVLSVTRKVAVSCLQYEITKSRTLPSPQALNLRDIQSHSVLR